MSVAATNYVWYVSTVEGSDRLVLLALADFADEDGNCFGSWGKLCQKTRLCRATIATSLKRLRAAGHLVMVEKGHRKLAGDGAEASIWQIPGVSEMGLKLRPVQDLDPSGLKLRPKWSKSQTQVVQDLDPNVKKHKEQEETKGADAPAAATPLPSPPSFPDVAVPRPKPPKFDPASLSLPHGTGLANAWAEFAQHRREIKAPLTPTAAKRIIDDLSAVNESAAVEALRKSVKHGWRGVFVETPKDTPKVIPMRTGPVQPSEAEKRMMALEALRAQQMKGAA
jgi:hypothetical protein